jgi:hypothetical protein
MNKLWSNGDRKNGSRRLTHEQMKDLYTPPPLGNRHLPIPHYEVVEVLENVIKQSGMEIVKSDYAVGGTTGEHVDTTLFGVLTLTDPDTLDNNDDEYGLAMGIRANNTRKFPVTLIAGGNVFVCDNLMLSGDSVVLKKKHTKNLNLIDEMENGIADYLDRINLFPEAIARLKELTLTDVEARAGLFKVFEQKVLPLKMLSPIARTYFEPEDSWTDCTPRSMWGIYNAITRCLRDAPTNTRMELTAALGKYFGL